MNANLLTETIAALIRQHGGVRPAARVLGIDPSYISRLGRGKKNAPSKLLLRKLGLRRVVTVTYERTTNKELP